MPRPLRLQFSAAIYHVINRGNYRHPIFASVGARSAFLKALDEAVMEFGWILHAFVLLNNHFHLALETPRANLTQGRAGTGSGRRSLEKQGGFAIG